MNQSLTRTKNRQATKAVVKSFPNVKKTVWTLHLAYPAKDAQLVQDFFAANADQGNRSSLGRHRKGDTWYELVVMSKVDAPYETKRDWRKALRSNINFALYNK